jgi:formate--tetrahydrofolate ligase
MKTDIEISQEVAPSLKSVQSLYSNQPYDFIEPYGKGKGKINVDLVKNPKTGKLILVTAITPTPHGEGKTTTTIGLADGLRKLGEDSIVCLREPALGPVFGMKGGATGGGYAQVVPMEDINLHFTGDFHAIASAHNLLSALIDNHIHWGNKLQIDPNTITWRRVSEMNDRSLRETVIGIGTNNGQTRQDGFDIVVASEVMAILCLAENFTDLKERLGNITVGYSYTHAAIRAKELEAHGAMAALLKDAIRPNIVQTLEGTPALIHGGPFANIAHGCNSVIATKLGLKLADYVVTEAGFGADLGAEKFIDIKCRKSGIRPDCVVLVATVRALVHHGDNNLIDGLANLGKHIENITKNYNLPCVVAINKFTNDTSAEISAIVDYCENKGITAVEASHWAEGGNGAIELAHEVLLEMNKPRGEMAFVYDDTDTLKEKITKIATKIYGASSITMGSNVERTLEGAQAFYSDYPICIAKTQSSFSDDPALLGAPKNHTLTVRELKICTGAGFIVAICGNMLTMPGLPVTPNAIKIDIDANGAITGLT